MILNQCASLTLMVVESTATGTHAIGGGIHNISMLQQRQLCWSCEHPIKTHYTNLQMIRAASHGVSQVVIFDNKFAAYVSYLLRYSA